MAVNKELFDAHLVADLVSKVNGKSTLAKLGQQTPVAFVGNKEFTFSLDQDVDIVAENGAKSHGGITMEPITMVPIKFEYGARVSDEFMTASAEERVNVLKAFNDGFAKKLAVGFDMAAMHGINPRSKVVSALVSPKSFDTLVTTTTAYDATKPDSVIETAIGLVEGAERECNGIAISPVVRADLAKMSNASGRIFPEFAFGGQPETLGNQSLDINRTVSVGVKANASAGATIKDHAIVGDYANMFKWGYGKDITLEVIEYGNPDNSDNGDLKGHNQVYLRAEAYIAWAIFDGASFARVIPA